MVKLKIFKNKKKKISKWLFAWLSEKLKKSWTSWTWRFSPVNKRSFVIFFHGRPFDVDGFILYFYWMDIFLSMTSMRRPWLILYFYWMSMMSIKNRKIILKWVKMFLEREIKMYLPKNTYGRMKIPMDRCGHCMDKYGHHLTLRDNLWQIKISQRRRKIKEKLW